MHNTLKKITSIGLSAILAIANTTVGANSPDTHHQSTVTRKDNTIRKSVKGKLSTCWSKIPKAAKACGGLVIFSVPIMIGGYIFYQNDTTPQSDYQKTMAAMAAISREYEKIKEKTSPTELDKMLMALIIYMSGAFIIFSHSYYKACLAQIDLLQLNSDQEIVNKINQLDRNILFLLTQMFQVENLINKELTDRIKLNSMGQLSPNELNNIDLLTQSIPQLNGKNLITWINTIEPLVSKRLQELNQKTFNRYGLTIQKSLGRGQSGEVYLCTNKEGQQVAVKVVPKNGNMISRMSAKNETAVWKQISNVKSDNVVKYKSQFSKSGIICFSMEYVDESEELTNFVPNSIDTVLELGKQIFAGLIALHAQNIAHRDIKLENILITKDNQIKICDFGLAKNAGLTVTVCGTPGMMPPEMQKHSGIKSKTDPRYSGSKFDVYSAAAVVYCLMFNKKSNDMENEYENILNLTENTPDRFGNPIGKKMLDFFKGCFNSDPDDRFTADKAYQLLNQM